MASKLLLLTALSSVVDCRPSSEPARQHVRRGVPQGSITIIGNTTSNLPNIYRDGGGGGKINGDNIMMFSDGLYTSSGYPADDMSNVLGFTSNSIACSNCDGQGLTSLQDFGTTDTGPKQQVPFIDGENPTDTAVWPNQNIASLCGGTCGVSFPQVIDRNAFKAGQDGLLYNTGVKIGLTGFGPAVERPQKALFNRGEPLFGTFATMVGVDGYLYMFATITKTSAQSNGLKMARVPVDLWADRSQYQYWDGSTWSMQMPAYADPSANILMYSQNGFGTEYGPGTGDIWYSPPHGLYVMVFQADDAALDNSGMLFSTSFFSPPLCECMHALFSNG